MKTILTVAFFFLLSFSRAQNTEVIEIACLNEFSNSFTYQADIAAKLVSVYLNSSKTAVDPVIEILPNGDYVLKADVFFTTGWGTAVILLQRQANLLVINQTSMAHLCMPAEEDPCIYKAEIDELVITKSVTCFCADGGKSRAIVSAGNLKALNASALSIRDLKSICN